MMNHSEALTEQVFSFASELYAYGVREVVISQVHGTSKHIQILKHGLR